MTNKTTEPLRPYTAKTIESAEKMLPREVPDPYNLGQTRRVEQMSDKTPELPEFPPLPHHLKQLAGDVAYLPDRHIQAYGTACWNAALEWAKRAVDDAGGDNDEYHITAIEKGKR